MTVSKDEKVQQLLDDLKLADSEKYMLLQSLRSVVIECCPTVAERIMYGGIMFSLEEKDFGGLFVYKNHISFEFTRGYLFEDPNNQLEGKGKFRRHLKLLSDADMVSKEVKFFIQQAIKNISNT